jgi:hypothetical protein
MKKRSLIAVALIVVLIAGSLMLSGCSNPAKEIVGSWKQVSDRETFSLIKFDDADAVYLGVAFKEDGSASLLITSAQGMGFVFEATVDFRYSVSGGVLEVTDAGGGLVHFQNSALPFAGALALSGDTFSLELADGTVLQFEKL